MVTIHVIPAKAEIQFTGSTSAQALDSRFRGNDSEWMDSLNSYFP